jgi:excisionase family DNA binding protein
MATTKKTTAPMERHTTIAGEELEYPRPGPELASFLARVRAAANDPRVSEHALVELIYGKENPLLDQTIFPGRGAVTRAAFENPVYHVMLDLLDQKRIAVGALDPERAAARYTMTVTEAAAELGITSSAVRQAVAAGHLPAWKKHERLLLLDPSAVATYRDHVKRRGPRAEPALRIRKGSATGASLRVRAVDLEVLEEEKRADGKVETAIVPSFKRAAIVYTGKRSNGSKYNHAFIIEPSDEHERIELGDFFVEGRFRIVEKITDAEEASKRFRSFRAE